jgi:hypothetical protein
MTADADATKECHDDRLKDVLRGYEYITRNTTNNSNFTNYKINTEDNCRMCRICLTHLAYDTCNNDTLWMAPILSLGAFSDSESEKKVGLQSSKYGTSVKSWTESKIWLSQQIFIAPQTFHANDIIAQKIRSTYFLWSYFSVTNSRTTTNSSRWTSIWW